METYRNERAFQLKTAPWTKNLKDVRIDKGSGDCVYFIQAEHGGPIKIGKSTNGHVNKRLSSLQTSSPYPLVVRRLVDGGHDLERSLHRHFSMYRCYGEWFYPAPEVAELAMAIAEGDELLERVKQQYDIGYNDGFVDGQADGAAQVYGSMQEHLAERMEALLPASACQNLPV